MKHYFLIRSFDTKTTTDKSADKGFGMSSDALRSVILTKVRTQF